MLALATACSETAKDCPDAAGSGAFGVGLGRGVALGGGVAVGASVAVGGGVAVGCGVAVGRGVALGGKVAVGATVGSVVEVSVGDAMVVSLGAARSEAPPGPPLAGSVAAGRRPAKRPAIRLRAGSQATKTSATTPIRSSGSTHHALSRRDCLGASATGSTARAGATGIGCPQTWQ